MKPFSHYQALIFDMDGTLVDSMPYHDQSWVVFLQEHQLSIDPETFDRDYHKGTLVEVMARLFPSITTEAELRAIGQRKEALFRELYKPHLETLPGVPDFLAALQKQNIPVGLATMGDQANIDFTLDGLGISAFFDATTGGDQVTKGKPHPEIFLETARKLHVDPAQCLAFEDTQSGIESAIAAGMDVVGVATQFPTEKLLALGCVNAIEDYVIYC